MKSKPTKPGKWARKYLAPLLCALSITALASAKAAVANELCPEGEVQALIVSDIAGKLGVLGPSQSNATKVVVDMINKDGGLLGCKINLTIKDEQLDPAVAVRELRKAISTNKPQVVFGPTLSSSLLSMSQVANAQKIPVFSGTGGDGAFIMDDRQPGNYTAITTLYQDGRAAAKYLADSGKCKKYGFLYPDIVSGRNAVLAFRTALKDAQPDAEIVVDQPYKLDNKDFGSIAQVISNAQADCVFGNVLGADLGTVYKVWNQRKLEILTMFMPDSATLAAIGNGNVPPNAHGIMRANVQRMTELPLGGKFAAAYKAEIGSDADEWGFAAASAVYMWAAIAKAANSFDYDKLAAAAGSGTLTFDSIYGDKIEIWANHQANVWSSIGPLADNTTLGYPYWTAEAKQIWTSDVISKQLLEDILSGKVSTVAAKQ
ncbi:MAG: ABC transporter substrate-binding protein [Parvibaculaceae bacterium]